MIIILKKIWRHFYIKISTIIFKYKHLNKEEHDFICKINGLKLKVNSHSVLAKPLYTNFGFEFEERKALKYLIKPGMIVLDIGANIGFYSIIFAKLVGNSGKVFSFEPYPFIADYLYDNIELNNFTNIFVFKKAISDRNGLADFYIFPSGQDVYNSLGAKTRIVENIYATKQIKVETITIDKFCEVNNLKKIDFIKIDVEGNEEKVLLGAQNILKANKNIIVMAELYEPSAIQCGCSCNRVISFMKEMGFQVYDVGNNGDLINISNKPSFDKKYYKIFKR